MTTLNPQIIRFTNSGPYSVDTITALLEDRKVLVFGEVNTELACSVIAQLNHLNQVDPEASITLWVSGPGGSVTDGEAILDFCHSLTNPIHTLGMGMCASMDALLLACAGDKGCRACLPNTQVLIHQPLGGAQGQATDIMIQAENIRKTRTNIYQQLALATGQDLQTVTKDCERDKYLNAQEALAYGLVDQVIQQFKNRKEVRHV